MIVIKIIVSGPQGGGKSLTVEYIRKALQTNQFLALHIPYRIIETNIDVKINELDHE